MGSKKIVFVSDFNFRGSGYLNISVPICSELSKRGYDIKAVGLGYTGEEHTFGFSIIPCMDFSDAHAMVNNLFHQWKPDVVIVALDIPKLDSFMRGCKQLGMKIIGITPLENPPLTFSWAYILQQLDKVFMISQMGADEAIKAGVENVEHLMIGMDTQSWRLRTPEEYKSGRKIMNISDDTLTVLTVADNQERKHLSKAFEIISKLKNEKKVKVKYILVTREHSDVGWKLRDLAMTYGIASEVMIFERGMSFKELYLLYAVADAFLLTSKAEGLCVFPETKLWTQAGIKFIKDVKVEDLVISHTGDIQEVTDTFVRKYSGNLVKIVPMLGFPEIKLTPTHKVLSAFGGKRVSGKRNISDIAWIDAKDLEKGDFIFYPEIKERDWDSLFVDDYVDRVGVDTLGIIHTIGHNQTDQEFLYSNREKSVKNEIDIDNDFMRLLGWYIAEGCDTSSGLSFSLNSNETEYQKEIHELMNRKFGLDVTDNFRDRSRYDGRVHSRILGNLFSSLCGQGSHNKHIPYWAMLLPEDKLWNLVETMFCGDGTLQKTPQLRLRYSTVSKELAHQLQFCLMRLGVVSSIHSSKTRCEYTVNISHPEMYKVPFIDMDLHPKVKKHQSTFIKVDGGWLLQIKNVEIENYDGDVYNLEVNNDHSYLLMGGTVHNCMPVLESMSVGVPVVATACGALPELLADGRGFLMDTEYSHIDPWGNGRRDFPSAESGAEILTLVLDDVVAPARKYMESRTWDKPIQQIIDALEKLDEAKPAITQ